jgi:hypothetical protein
MSNTAPWRYLLCLSLTVLLAAQAPAPAKLNILIVEGDGAINNVRQRTAREAIVQVEDENHRPVAGAAVLFLLPGSGPSGTFAGGGRSLMATTDSKGQAVARGLRVNNVSGKFQISVEASYQGVTATTTITQANAVITAAAVGGVSGKLIAILAAVGGAAAVGAVVATRGSGTSATAPPATVTTLTPGTPTVGRP